MVNGRRGMITSDDRTSIPYKVTFDNGEVSGWLYPDQVTRAVEAPTGGAKAEKAAKKAAARKAKAERAALLAKHVAEAFMVPPSITVEMAQEVKSSVRSLIPDDTEFEVYYPEVSVCDGSP